MRRDDSRVRCGVLWASPLSDSMTWRGTLGPRRRKAMDKVQQDAVGRTSPWTHVYLLDSTDRVLSELRRKQIQVGGDSSW